MTLLYILQQDISFSRDHNPGALFQDRGPLLPSTLHKTSPMMSPRGSAGGSGSLTSIQIGWAPHCVTVALRVSSSGGEANKRALTTWLL